MNGHANVSMLNDKSLGQFCAQVRFARKNPSKGKTKLTNERIAAFNAIASIGIHRSTLVQEGHRYHVDVLIPAIPVVVVGLISPILGGQHVHVVVVVNVVAVDVDGRPDDEAARCYVQ
jgi:hypothetical protein